ncbi:MAG: phage minor capsid protein [Oscillospiraceae bacterium]
MNLVNTVMQYKAKSSYTTLVNKIYDDTKRQELLGVLGKHTLEVASGGTNRQEAVWNCIKEFSQKGIPAFVDKRGREWSPEAYINMDIRTTVNNTANAAQDACCDRYGLDLIAISSHMGARPKCAVDQGKLYSRSNRSGIAHDGDGNPIPFYPWSSTSYGQPDGILGINCHHHKYPFADGVNFQRYFPYDQEENAARYKEFQKQRAMERRVREVSRHAEMLEATGDTEGAKAARRQLREKRKAYREYSKEHGLGIHNDKLTVVKIKNGDTSYRNIYSSGLTDKGGSGIIEAGSDKVLKVNTGGRRNELPLSEEQISEIKSYAVSLGMPEQRIYYVDYDCTGYGASFDLLRIGTDVYPSREYNRSNANSNVSMHGAIAHEIIGHRMAALAGKSQDNEVLEEAQASIRAAKFTPNLDKSERIILYRDAITRLKNNNIKLKDIKNKLHIFEE